MIAATAPAGTMNYPSPLPPLPFVTAFDSHPAVLAPAQPATAIPGWCFFPGLESSDHDIPKTPDADELRHPADLAARAESLGAVAFNTKGAHAVHCCWKAMP